MASTPTAQTLEAFLQYAHEQGVLSPQRPRSPKIYSRTGFVPVGCEPAMDRPLDIASLSVVCARWNRRQNSLKIWRVGGIRLQSYGSANPNISRMFCTAAPEAPLPRLSRRATRSACRAYHSQKHKAQAHWSRSAPPTRPSAPYSRIVGMADVFFGVALGHAQHEDQKRSACREAYRGAGALTPACLQGILRLTAARN